MAKKNAAAPSTPTPTPEAQAPVVPTPAPAPVYTGPVAFIKSHTTVVFGQKTRACPAIARSPRGHDMVCDRPAARVPHLLHAMGEARPNGVRVVFWKVQNAVPAAAPAAPAAPATPTAPKAARKGKAQ